jgi:hypothetical protein
MSDIQEINIDTENDLPKRKLPEDTDINLSVFRSGWSWKTWHGFWENIKWFFRALRPAWHRATKGYCRMDTWNVDYTLTAYLIKVLTEFRNATNGWPDQHFATFEEWIAAIDDCIDNLIASTRDRDEINDWYPRYKEFLHKGTANWTEEEKDIFHRYIDEDQLLYLAQNRAREKAFAFLGEYLPHIWW